MRARRHGSELYHPGKWKLEQYTMSWEEIEEYGNAHVQRENACAMDSYFYFGVRIHVDYILGEGGGCG